MEYKVDIIKLARKGSSLAEISELSGTNIVELSMQFKDITDKTFSKIRREGLSYHLDKVASRRLHIFQVREAFDLTPLTLYEYVCRLGKNNIFEMEAPITAKELKRLREGLGINANEEIHELLDQGLDLSKISRSMKISLPKQSVGYYIKGSGQYTYYRAVKRKIWVPNTYTQGASANS